MSEDVDDVRLAVWAAELSELLHRTNSNITFPTLPSTREPP